MSYKSDILANHPIAYWPLDETSGTIANDISGNGHNGTYVGSTIFQNQPGTPNLAPSLIVNSPSYITVPDFTIVAPVTFEFWFKKTISNSAYQFISKGTGFTIISVNSNQILFRLPALNDINSSNSFGFNFWHYVVVTYDSDGTIAFYVDGNQLLSYQDRFGNTILFPIIPESISNSDPLLLGPAAHGPTQGNMMHIAIYDYILIGTHINDHYNFINTSNVRYRQSNLVGGMTG